MKVCPRCQKTYTDDNLNFCLEDGSVLNQMSAAPPPPPTQAMNEPRPTAPPQGMASGQPGWNVPPQGQQYAMPNKKSSKTWVWVLLILGVIVLLCGGGLAAILFFAKNATNELANAINSGNFNASKGTKGNSNSTSTTDTTTTSSRTSIDSIDLSDWVPTSSKYASIEYTDSELLVKNNEKNYYYVLAGTTEQKSVGGDSVITVRNVNNGDTSLGYGLVFHSMTTPLIQGYAFVIDAKKKRYRIVHHTPGKEASVVNWTSSPLIKDGSQANTLEARDGSGTIDLYINGTKVNSIKNDFGYSDGVIGIYASNNNQIAFKDMQIRH
ncbi:MAG TPA: hypothetical protein VGO43_04410 [Pyrinomonadaceae bacterium]|jgi:hypothetical protein|nr:hypothetical protein [Pyrinomonadaceae bacterium]